MLHASSGVMKECSVFTFRYLVLNGFIFIYCGLAFLNVSIIPIGTVETPSLIDRLKKMGGGDESKVYNRIIIHNNNNFIIIIIIIIIITKRTTL